jgi:hypothetical protein
MEIALSVSGSSIIIFWKRLSSALSFQNIFDIRPRLLQWPLTLLEPVPVSEYYGIHGTFATTSTY